jgi:hypothetical protein
MKSSIKTLLFSTVLISFIAFSCSKDELELELVKEGGPFAISELTGNWEANSANFFRVSDGLQADIIADGGSLSLTVQSSGRCTFTIDPFDRDAYMVSGEMFWGRYEGEDALAVVFDDSPDDRSYFRYIELTDTIFNLSCTSECGEYDFNNDGTSETADLVFDFIRD